jgi:hypothetical protein
MGQPSARILAVPARQMSISGLVSGAATSDEHQRTGGERPGGRAMRQRHDRGGWPTVSPPGAAARGTAATRREHAQAIAARLSARIIER